MKRYLKFNNPIFPSYSINNLKRCLDNKFNPHGPGKNINLIINFLKSKFKFKDVLLTNSCSSALEIAAFSLIDEHDSRNEIIIPSYSFVTTGSSFVKANFKLKYINIDENNFMPSFDNIKAATSKKTKAIVITHYQGFSVNFLDKLSKYCKQNNLYLIEDAAQALGSCFKHKYLGNFGDFATFSFHYTKNLHAGIGGCLVINNRKFSKFSRYIYDKGTNRSDQLKNPKLRYSWVNLGGSFLMSELHASYLYPQLKRIDNIINYRKKFYLKYLNILRPYSNYFKILDNKNNFIYNYHALSILCLSIKLKNFIINLMKKNDIEFFTGYFPLHLSDYGKKFKAKNLKKTENLYNRILRIPLNNNINNFDIEKIDKLLKKNLPIRKISNKIS